MVQSRLYQNRTGPFSMNRVSIHPAIMARMRSISAAMANEALAKKEKR